MGGRGAKYKIVTGLPNYKMAVFPRNKFKNYILNPSKDSGKAKYFKSIGYNMKNWKLLNRDIKKKLATNKALKYKANARGDTEYQVNMMLGIGNKKRMTTTAWTIKKGENVPRFVTAYKNDKFKKKR